MSGLQQQAVAEDALALRPGATRTTFLHYTPDSGVARAGTPPGGREGSRVSL